MNHQMQIYRYTAHFGDYESQEIIIIAKTAPEALVKLKAYLEKNNHHKLAIEARESDLTWEINDVFQTWGVDG